MTEVIAGLRLPTLVEATLRAFVAGVRERFGVLWLAPAEPRDVPLDLPEATDRLRGSFGGSLALARHSATPGGRDGGRARGGPPANRSGLAERPSSPEAGHRPRPAGAAAGRT